MLMHFLSVSTVLVVKLPYNSYKIYDKAIKICEYDLIQNCLKLIFEQNRKLFVNLKFKPRRRLSFRPDILKLIWLSICRNPGFH